MNFLQAVSIPSSAKHAAQLQADQMGALRQSVLAGAGNLAGFCGEWLAAASIPRLVLQHSYDHDAILTLSDESEVTLDVKTNRYGRTAPRDYYSADIYESSLHQRCAVYAFVHVTEDYTQGWVIGVVRREDFFAHATKRTKGDVNPRNPQERLRATSYSLSYGDIRRLSIL